MKAETWTAVHTLATDALAHQISLILTSVGCSNLPPKQEPEKICKLDYSCRQNIATKDHEERDEDT